MSVLEWRVTQLEAQAKETLRVMDANKTEILTQLKTHNDAITKRLEKLTSRSGEWGKNALQILATVAAITAAVVAAVKH